MFEDITWFGQPRKVKFVFDLYPGSRLLRPPVLVEGVWRGCLSRRHWDRLSFWSLDVTSGIWGEG